jgi:hypothetical protein
MADSGIETRGLGKRLLIAGLLSAVIAGVCWWLLPRAHIDVPWYVPIVAFGVMLAAALLGARDASEGDDGDEDEPEVAGRIGDGQDLEGEV